jgi:hypothetical protein
MSDTFMEKLEELRKKHPSELTEPDRAFLRSRSSYLQEHEIEALGLNQPKEEALIPEDEPMNEPAPEGTLPAPATEDEPAKPAKKSRAKAKPAEAE